MTCGSVRILLVLSLLKTMADLAGSVNFCLTQMGFPTHSLESYNMFVGNGISK